MSKQILVIYDSAYGNTARVATIIGGALTGHDKVKVLAVNNVSMKDVYAADLIIVGSPTQGGRPLKTVSDFIDYLPKNALMDVPVAAFDTRFAINEHGVGLHVVMGTIGFAAKKIAAKLQAKGGRMTSEPMGFIVEDKHGPLQEGEQERAVGWAHSLVESVAGDKYLYT